MTLDEFLDIQPLFFAKLTEKADKQIKRSHGRTEQVIEVMVGQLIAMVANTGFVRFKESRRPQEFMPSQIAEAEARDKAMKPAERKSAAWARYNVSKEAFLSRTKRADSL